MRTHLPEYLAEFFGTAIMMIVGIGAVALMWASGSPMLELIPSGDLRRLLTGIMFAGGATLVVLSPLGQRSGGHLNPAVTLAFWFRGQVKGLDAICYVVAQTLGAIFGLYLLALVGGTWVESVALGITLPGEGYSVMNAFIAELIITFLLMFLILYCVSDQRFAKKTPYLAGSLVAFLVFVEAPISGTSLNPARSFAPALLGSNFNDHWLYWIAPPLGALLAVFVFAVLFPRQKRGCAKLYHTEKYRCIFAQCSYTLIAAGEVLIKEGDPAHIAYVIESGELEVRKRDEQGAEKVLARLGPGAWVGEMGLLLNLPCSASVIAVKDSQLRPVTVESFAHVIAEHPEETRDLLKQLSERLYAANKSIVL